MKRWFPFLVFLLTWSLAANQPQDIQKADSAQKKIIKDLEKEISSYHLSIQSLYKYINKIGLVKKNRTRIPLLAQRKVDYERKREHIYNVEGIIHWSGSQISFIQIRERDSLLRREKNEQRHWFGRLEVTEKAHSSAEDKKPKYVIKGYNVDLITLERLEFGDTELLMFRVNTANETENRPYFLKPPEHGLSPEPSIRYVEEPLHRIRILREYLRLVILLEHRAKYFTRKVRIGAEDKLKHLLRPKP